MSTSQDVVRGGIRVTERLLRIAVAIVLTLVFGGMVLWPWHSAAEERQRTAEIDARLRGYDTAVVEAIRLRDSLKSECYRIARDRGLDVRLACGAP